MISCAQVVSEGIAYGKVSFIREKKELPFSNESKELQLKNFNEAIEEVANEIDAQIEESKTTLNQRISDIFETHKYIVKDPMILNRTFELIKDGLDPNSAYIKSVAEILEEFQQIDNEYMLGRIVDILDATDRVKVKLKLLVNETTLITTEPTILIIKELKPSFIYSITDKNIKGFISESGYYHQHSSIIARTINIPGLVCKDIFKNINEGDYILIDCNQSEIYINPTEHFIRSRTGGQE